MSETPKFTPDLHEAATHVLAALERLGYPMSEYAWHNVGDDAPVNDQASRECRAMHNAAVELRDALSKARGESTTPETEG